MSYDWHLMHIYVVFYPESHCIVFFFLSIINKMQCVDEGSSSIIN